MGRLRETEAGSKKMGKSAFEFEYLNFVQQRQLISYEKGDSILKGKANNIEMNWG